MATLRNLREDAAEALPSLLGAVDIHTDRGDLIGAIETACLHFQIVAAATLLVDGNPQGFFLNLCRAAENWRRLQRHCRQKAWEPPPASRTGPLLGAVAAGSWSLADGLLADAATSWQVGAEYEDDYAYAAVLHAVARRGGASAAELDRLLETLERAGAETYGTRLDLIRALAAGVEAPFVDAFADAHREQEVLTETRARSLTTPVTSFAPHRYIWLEGLALLRLAEHAGLRIDREFLYCPPLARVPMAVAYSGDWVVSIGG